MKSAAARRWFIGVAYLGVVVVLGGCSVSELGLVDNTTDQTIGSSTTAIAEEVLAAEAEAETAAPGEQAEAEAAAGVADSAAQDDAAGIEQDDEGSDVLAGPRLPIDSQLVFRSGTCFQPPFVGADAEQVPCDEPHQIQVFASSELPAGPDDRPPSAEVAARICNDEFSAIAGIGLALATVLEPSVLLPSEQSWAEGEREVTCYVVYPTPTVDSLSEIDPLRVDDQVSIYGLQTGDCLVDLDPAETSFELVTCDKPHDGEVFATYDLPAGAFPGASLIEPLAAELCFGQGFTDFIGVAFVDSMIDALQSAPTAETWALGHHRISCIATDGLVRTGSLAGASR